MNTRPVRHRILSPRRWSLRARLLAGQVLLLVTVVVGIGVTTEFALQQFLVDQLDGQVHGAQKRALMTIDGGPFHGPPPFPAGPPPFPPPPGAAPGPWPPADAGPPPRPPYVPTGAPVAGVTRVGAASPATPPDTAFPGPDPQDPGAGPPFHQPPRRSSASNGPGPGFLGRPGVPQDEIGAVVNRGIVSAAGKLEADGNRTLLTASARRQLAAVPATGRPRTMHIDGLGSYRVVADTSRRGPTVVTGLALASVDATLMRVLAVLLSVTAVVLLIAVTVGITLIRRALAPLDRVAATAYQVAALPLDHGEVALPVRVSTQDADPHTEVGSLGAAVNRMLDNITGALSARHASETRVRQFVADASHELRTPLAAIRGYTELAQRRSDELSEEVADAVSRVDAAALRMSGLVEDLLLLARLDSGRPLEREPVDLSRLTVDAASDAHIAGPGHRWDLELPDEPVTVTGDGIRLHQVLANLLANARVHTPPGTVVTVGLEPDEGGAIWRVTDTGPGIPAELQPEIFQRFARGDSSRSRRAGSTGLGLAIADAVIRAHGGVILLTSVPGHTEFTVRLPGTTGDAPPL
ncbi:ATP-binding protein [Nocardia alni]|uniref:ATP-binding protein n=1 Tax=Nocardia alni TaxID=2815723 RepID=UPI001C24B568|nr:ATP-binding protein [Nocardia alni]